MLGFIGGIGPQELIIIFLIVLLLFGGKKIPEIARGLGKGMKEFKKARDDIRDSIEKDADEKAQAGEGKKEQQHNASPESEPDNSAEVYDEVASGDNGAHSDVKKPDQE